MQINEIVKTPPNFFLKCKESYNVNLLGQSEFSVLHCYGDMSVILYQNQPSLCDCVHGRMLAASLTSALKCDN